MISSPAGSPFVRLLGEPVFVETFGRPDTLFFIMADGTEGELAVGRESAYREVANGPHRVLLDKTGVLEGGAFVGRHPDEDEQREELRRLVVWFWHDLPLRHRVRAWPAVVGVRRAGNVAPLMRWPDPPAPRFR